MASLKIKKMGCQLGGPSFKILASLDPAVIHDNVWINTEDRTLFLKSSIEIYIAAAAAAVRQRWAPIYIISAAGASVAMLPAGVGNL